MQGTIVTSCRCTGQLVAQLEYLNTPMTETQSRAHTALVQMRGITKSYPGCLANDAIDLTLKAGSIHALLGENGAGKSTLVKILYGLLSADSGSVLWHGKPVQITEPAVARELGIAMVFQHFSLFDSLSVLENIALGMGVKVSRALHQRVLDVSANYGLPLDPDRSVYSLSVGERQRIEIVRCLLQSPKVLIMDEPTSVLTPQEVERLFDTLFTLADEGVAILYISHKLEEIKQLCSEATILRQGRNVAVVNPAQETVAGLASIMMGDELTPVSKRGGQAFSGQSFSINGLQLRAKNSYEVSLQDIHLHVAAGEIVGIAGVAGNGQDELLQVISGERSADSVNCLFMDDRSLAYVDAGERRRLGLSCVPEERLGHAAVPGLSLAENAFLTSHHRHPLRVYGFISNRRTRTLTNDIIKTFNVQCDGPDSLASSLSGGNLQKFIVGREIFQNPRVLVISQPTWGVDAGAAQAIHQAIRQLALQGAAVLLISQDLDELMTYTDRIGALCAGKLSTFHTTSELTVQQVGLLMGGESLAGIT